MAVSKLTRFVVSAAAGFALAGGLAGAARADGQMHPQTHHCKMPDGSMDMTKTHKQCTAAKGTWFKDAPTPGAGSAAPAPTKPAAGAGSGSAAPAK